MSSKKMADTALPALPINLSAELEAASRTGTKLFFEDGWIFSQQPGKGVECLRRIEDNGPAAELHPGT
jgi:hypothetical protein